ncbi:MAG: hypothetical protein EZS28_010641 [Streblomastix strix]|uniref:Uncharacterized protein n=1 Tax=Streblomastix strix TaxID=222440 RepID=A0A5J4WH03_9EUKA|nr:MAG: hypothetical protein EZS28_010641 [Streblomastix strix]
MVGLNGKQTADFKGVAYIKMIYTDKIEIKFVNVQAYARKNQLEATWGPNAQPKLLSRQLWEQAQWGPNAQPKLLSRQHWEQATWGPNAQPKLQARQPWEQAQLWTQLLTQISIQETFNIILFQLVI